MDILESPIGKDIMTIKFPIKYDSINGHLDLMKWVTKMDVH